MKIKLLALMVLLGICSCTKPASESDGKTDNGEDNTGEVIKPSLDKFYKGTTMCFASYLQDMGLVYRENGAESDPYTSVKQHGANIVRLQLDQCPFDNYNGLTIDWQTYSRVLADMKKAKEAGLDVFLTLKPDYDIFSESTVSHNNIPESWKGESDSKVGDLLYQWVYDTLDKLHKEGVQPAVVAVGNEVNVGFLKPSAGSNDASRTGALLARGFAAVRKFAADNSLDCAIALHIADPAKAESYISSIEAAGGKDYDIIALSYYPGKDIGHTLPYNSVKTTLEALKRQFGKPSMIVETAYSFTTGTVNGSWMGDWCSNAYNYPDWDDAVNSVNYTPAKQREWLRSLAEEVKAAGGAGLISWGTESLPDLQEGNGNEQGHGTGLYTYPAEWAYGSTWENNSYWDFTDGNNLHEGIDWMKDVQ